MSNPYIGEIRMFAGNFAPVGWAFCNGQIMAITQNDTPFNLIGTTYGGDGQSTFALPDLQGRLPVNMGSGFLLSEKAGTESVTLTVSQIPAHHHSVQVVTEPAESSKPAGRYLAQSDDDLYATSGSDTTLLASAVGPTSGSQPHDNSQPYLCVNFIISLFGIFPSQN